MGIGFKELVIILVIVLIIFGIGKLPKVMKDLGSGIKEFKKGMGENNDDKGAKGE
ncbi:MAG: twin-arginine translocase TatA/TatE family subunit [Bdellovibrionales bacterium]